MKQTRHIPGVLHVYDDVLVDPSAYRAAALGLTFLDVPDGDTVFRGIARCEDPELPNRLLEVLPPGAQVRTSFFRKSPQGQDEPNFIHVDTMMGDWTAILYLNEAPPDGDGTSFWCRRSDGAETGPFDASVRNVDLFHPTHHVDAKFNRALIFRADLYHSRGLIDNYGEGAAARLIQVVFGTGALERSL